MYRTLRELAMSYFHEYCNRRDHKTLREYSVPFDLRRVDPAALGRAATSTPGRWRRRWTTCATFALVNGHLLREVARRDPFERRAGRLQQYRKPRKLPD